MNAKQNSKFQKTVFNAKGTKFLLYSKVVGALLAGFTGLFAYQASSEDFPRYLFYLTHGHHTLSQNVLKTEEKRVLRDPVAEIQEGDFISP